MTLPNHRKAEADRARAILWSLERRTGEEIGGLVGVKANTVRKWRGRFRNHGVDGLRARPHPGRAPWKTPAALRVADEVLSEPVINGANWTLPRRARSRRHLDHQALRQPGHGFEAKGDGIAVGFPNYSRSTDSAGG